MEPARKGEAAPNAVFVAVTDGVGENVGDGDGVELGDGIDSMPSTVTAPFEAAGVAVQFPDHVARVVLIHEDPPPPPPP